ncbi:hypothetical protein HDU91_000492 [Kappamyces sp. JEL0680]|nr:hypothetical protein HDU91_000492 [Kappamyces sp. JEL0680]
MDRAGAFGDEWKASSFQASAANQGWMSSLFSRPSVQKAAVEKASVPAFQFAFDCDASVDKKLCGYAQQGFQSAGERIAQVLSIRNTVVVSAKFHSFCAAQGGGDCTSANNILGRARSAAFFAASNPAVSSSVYYYPQALVKQMQTSDTLTYADTDIFAEFNSDFAFWFKSSGLPIGANQTDFEFVVSHELTHGLGMETSWVQYGSFFKGITANTNYLAPLPFAEGGTQANAIVSVLSPLTVFDQYLASPSGSLANFGQQITQFKGAGMALASFISSFEKSASPFASAKQAMTAATAGQSSPLQFQTTSSGSPLVVQLNTPTTYTPGTSIVHLQSTVSTTKDFLMIPAITPLLGKKLDDILGNVKATTIYGPGITGIMQAMGWPTVQSPAQGNLKIVRDLTQQSAAFGLDASFVFAAMLIASSLPDENKKGTAISRQSPSVYRVCAKATTLHLGTGLPLFGSGQGFYQSFPSHDTWRTMTQLRFAVGGLDPKVPGSFRSWKGYYACLHAIEAGSLSFRIFLKQGFIPKATPHQVHQRSLKYVHVGKDETIGEGCCENLPAKEKRRYLFAITAEPAQKNRFIVYENTVWFLFQNGELKGKSLVGRPPAIIATEKGRLRKLIVSNGKGMCVTLDSGDLIEIWRIVGTDCRKTNQIQILKPVSSLDVYNDQLAVLLKDGSISIWDTTQGVVVSALKLDRAGWNLFVHAKDTQLTLSSNMLVVGMGSFYGLEGFPREIIRQGVHLVYTKDKFGLYTLLKAIPDYPELSDHEFRNSFAPSTLAIRNQIILVNGNDHDELCLWKVEGSLPGLPPDTKKPPGKGFSPTHRVHKLVSLSQKAMMKSFGFHSIQRWGGLCLAGWDPDGSMIIGSHENLDLSGLLVWDFRQEYLAERYFHPLAVGDLKLWLCFEID